MRLGARCLEQADPGPGPGFANCPIPTSAKLLHKTPIEEVLSYALYRRPRHPLTVARLVSRVLLASKSEPPPDRSWQPSTEYTR